MIVRVPNRRVIIITFNTRTNKFDSNYERNKFFRDLYGWQQTVPGQNREKRYVYHRQGLLDKIPSERIGDSVFMVAEEHIKRVEAFFEQWRKKVEYDIIEVMMERQRFLKHLREREKIDNQS